MVLHVGGRGLGVQILPCHTIAVRSFPGDLQSFLCQRTPGHPLPFSPRPRCADHLATALHCGAGGSLSGLL